jgi:hypothetical protein
MDQFAYVWMAELIKGEAGCLAQGLYGNYLIACKATAKLKTA